MKVSIVIPAYNEEAYLADCIRAVLAEIEREQVDAEVIVVNNASVDRTAEVAQSFPEVLVVHEPRKGLSQARQSGFLASSGELIANLDADSRIPSGWMKKVLEEFTKDSELVALSGPYIYYDMSKMQNIFVRLFYYVAYVFYVIDRFVLRVSSMVQGGNFVLRRSALEKIGGFDVSYHFYGEDTDIAHRMHQVGKVKFTMKLPTHTSGRRLAKEGVLVMGARYIVNHFWTIFKRKPYTHTVNDL